MLFISLVFIMTCLPAGAAIYSWKDKNGTTHFSDNLPPSNVQDDTVSPVEQAISTGHYNVTVFKILKADDPGIVGTYVPIHSTEKDLPQYELIRKEKKSKEKNPLLFVVDQDSRWQWKIKTDYSDYTSNIVKEGTTPDKADTWRNRHSDVVLSVAKQDIETTRRLFDHTYRYDLNRNSPNLPDWHKQAFRVSGHPEMILNGDYYPVSWSSDTPRYRTSWDTCLVQRSVGTSWQWYLGKCELFSYSSTREPAETMPHQVQRWIRNAGMQVISFTIEQIER